MCINEVSRVFFDFDVPKVRVVHFWEGQTPEQQLQRRINEHARLLEDLRTKLCERIIIVLGYYTMVTPMIIAPLGTINENTLNGIDMNHLTNIQQTVKHVFVLIRVNDGEIDSSWVYVFA